MKIKKTEESKKKNLNLKVKTNLKAGAYHWHPYYDSNQACQQAGSQLGAAGCRQIEEWCCAP